MGSCLFGSALDLVAGRLEERGEFEIGSERVERVVEVEPEDVQLGPEQSVWASAETASGPFVASLSQPEAEHPPCAQLLNWWSYRARELQYEGPVQGQEVDGGQVQLQESGNC